MSHGDDIRRQVARVDPRRVALATAVLIVVVGAAGSPLIWEPPRRLNLDREGGLPALFGALLLLLAAGLCLLAAASRGGYRPSRAPLRSLALIFSFMAADEWAHLHERLHGLAGLDWPVVYLPLMLVAGVLWFLVFKTLRGRGATALWIAGAGAWAAATLLEQFLYGPHDEQLALTMTLEEVLEFAGSASFALALLVRIRSTG